MISKKGAAHTVIPISREPEANKHLQTLVNWVCKTNTEHVPSQYQQHFLEHPVVNRAILEMGKVVGASVKAL